jgi:hypothetical protein
VPPQIFTAAERRRLAGFPAELDPAEVIRWFTLTPGDIGLVRRERGDANRLGVAVQLCALRALGFVPADLAGAPPERRYPILVCFGAHAVTRITDGVVDAFDRALASSDRRAHAELDELRRRNARATNDKVLLLIELGRAVLEARRLGVEALPIIEQRIGLDRVETAVQEAERLARPRDDSYVDLLDDRFAYLRQSSCPRSWTPSSSAPTSPPTRFWRRSGPSVPSKARAATGCRTTPPWGCPAPLGLRAAPAGRAGRAAHRGRPAHRL